MKSFKSILLYVVLLAVLVGLTGLPVGAENRQLFDLDALDCVIDPSQVSDLGSGVPGLLSAVKVDRSDFVTAGQVVAELDSGVEAAAVELAKARAELTAEVDLRQVNAAFGKRQEARSGDLYRKKVISENDMDQRQTETRIAQLQLLQAMDNKRLAAIELNRAEQVLQRRTIQTPISGVVMERFKSAGEYVDDQPVLRVAQLDPLYVEVILPVEVLGQVEDGMQAEVWSEPVGSQVWQAEVSRIDRVADAASGTYGVRLTLPNPDYHIPAGLRCQLRFVRSKAPQLSDTGDLSLRTKPAAESSAPHGAVDGTDPAPAQPLVADEAPEPTASQPQDENGQSSDFSILAEKADPLVETPPLCRKVGPLHDRAKAEQLVAQLTDLGFDVQLDEKPTESLRGYQVVSASQPSFAKAKNLLTRLRTAGIEDAAIMRVQGVQWVVSLGLFRHKSRAKVRVEQLAAKDFAATLTPWKKTESTYSLAVSGRLDAQASELIGALPQSAVQPAESCRQLASR